MHRVALRDLRGTYLAAARRVTRSGSRGFHMPRQLGATSRRRSVRAHDTRAAHVEPLHSTMYFRRGTTVAALSALAGFGAWLAYGPPIGLDGSLSRSFTAGGMAPTGVAAPDAIPTRKVLVVGANELHTGVVVGDGPLSKTTSDDGRKIVEMITPDQASVMLRRTEQSFIVDRGEGVVRYDVVQLPSNDPIEDDHAEQIVEIPGPHKQQNRDWMFWGVFDGHRGWTTSAKLRQSLIGAVAQSLNDTYTAAAGVAPAGDDIDKAIKTAFTRLDDDIVHRSVEKVFKSNSRTLAAEALAPAYSGSCALLSFYDTQTKELRVACTGDSRAVLGRRAASGNWVATPLSVDQTGSNPDEERRIRDAHPGEKTAVFRGRVLGQLEPTRAFGDATYKWSHEVSERLRGSFFGRSVHQYLLTPPYVTAEPEVTTTTIRPENGDFMVMATDGLWEMLTNDEVVGLVGRWLETEGRVLPGAGSGSLWTKLFGASKADQALPVEQAGQKTPVGQKTPGNGAPETAGDRYIVKDRNVATHLIRNALGGKKEEQVCALLTLPAPHSRRFRDDLTVQVILFGRGESTGEVRVNPGATKETTEPGKPGL